MEMLKIMRQEMQERDNHLKIQLQLRNEYMDAEIKRRDQNLEEALRLRDEEWKSRWEPKKENSEKSSGQGKMPSCHISSRGTVSYLRS